MGIARHSSGACDIIYFGTESTGLAKQEMVHTIHSYHTRNE